MFMTASMSVVKHIQASLSNPINATVKISVCGNNIAEGGEDCDNSDLRSRTCTGLGYSSGNLACDISCSFDTTSCTVPSINSTNIASSEITSLLPAGYFTIPLTDSIISTASLTTTSQLTFVIPMNGGTGTVVLPNNLVITRIDGANIDPTTLTTSAVTTSSLSGFSQGVSVDGALMWGLASYALQFSSPVTISIYVGTSLDGQTLNIVRSASTDSGWTSDGIVSSATCVVTAGLCTFQANRTIYFAATRTVAPTLTPTPTPTVTPTPTPTPTTAASSSSSSNGSATTTNSSTSNSTATPASVTLLHPIIPDVLKFYIAYLDNNGRIPLNALFSTVKFWVDDWKKVMTEELAVTKGETIRTRGRRCDINQDNRCDIKDLSVLLFYVEK